MMTEFRAVIDVARSLFYALSQDIIALTQSVFLLDVQAGIR